MAKYKVGDRVRVVEDGWADSGPAVGTEGTVVVENGTIPGIRWDGFEGGHDCDFDDGSTDCWHVAEGRLERAAHAPVSPDSEGRSFVIAVGEDGKARTTTWLSEHSTKQDAVDNAERRARCAPGKHFAVVTATYTVKAEADITLHSKAL